MAPGCNIQCNFCDRKFDCLNETRPGVTSAVLSPAQAAGYLDKVMEKLKNISVVGIAGPGDPFANAEKTLETLSLIRGKYPDMLLCTATNGLELGKYAGDLAEIGLSHITVTLNAVDPEIGEKIYAWVKLDKRIYRGREAAQALLEKQEEGIRKVHEKGITVKINTVIIPGFNDKHVRVIAEKAREFGADVMNCMPMYHVAGTPFEAIDSPGHELMAELRKEAEKFIPQMEHCMRCRADAAGLIGGKESSDVMNLLKNASYNNHHTTPQRPYIAASSREGLFVNSHLGEAESFWIYGCKDGVIELKERRSAPVPGSGIDRWLELGMLLKDCSAILASGIGSTPKTVLEGMGIKVIVMEGLVRDGLTPLFNKQDIPKALLINPGGGKCGIGSCGGTGGGCG